MIRRWLRRRAAKKLESAVNELVSTFNFSDKLVSDQAEPVYDRKPMEGMKIEQKKVYTFDRDF